MLNLSVLFDLIYFEGLRSVTWLEFMFDLIMFSNQINLDFLSILIWLANAVVL